MDTLYCPKCGNAMTYHRRGKHPPRASTQCSQCGSEYALTFWHPRGLEMRLRVRGFLGERLTGGGSTTEHTP